MESVDDILNRRKPAAAQATEEENKYYSILLGDNTEEHFLEFRFRTGMRSCLPYQDIVWFNYDPEDGVIDLEFGSMTISVQGTGLEPLFNGIKQKKVRWIREKDVEMEVAAAENSVFVSEIYVETADEREKRADKAGQGNKEAA